MVELVSQTLPILEPVYEFGAWQSQPDLSDMRPFFAGKKYIGCDIRQGPGVDQIMDLHDTGLLSESVGTVLLLETLEHVQFPMKAVDEVYRILKPNGIVVMSSVMNYPIHDAHDYWRFTPEGFVTLLKHFPLHFVEFAGDPSFPAAVVGIGVKGPLPPAIADDFKKRIAEWKQSWNDDAAASSGFPKSKPWKNAIKSLTPPLILDLYRRCRRTCPSHKMWKNVIKLLTPPIVLSLHRRVRGQALFESVPHRLVKADLQQLFPGIEAVSVSVPCAPIVARPGQLPLTELVVLASVCKHLKPRRIFEIGTYQGASALTMAMNTPADTEILTLDLDPTRREDTKYRVEIGDITGLPFTVGGLYHGTEFQSKIRQLYGDSAVFDFGQFHHSADLVFVDGNHAYENVQSDSQNAFRMVRPGGIVMWDDYHPECGPAIMRYLNDLSNSRGVVQINGTRLAVYVER